MRKAPTVTKRVTARKSFFPLVPDETHEGMERRRDAYRACWAAADAHVSRVLAEANAEAFEKLEAFVKARFAERAEMRRANGGVVPQHAAQLIPVGLVLAGGVNSDDHEETFTKLTHHLRETGCHTALLRSRDLRARGAGGAAAAAAAAAGANESGPAVIAGASGGGGGGGGGGGLGVATRHILAQLRAGAGAGADATRVSGRSVRHLKRWYREVTEEDEPIDRSEAETEKTEKDGGDGDGNGEDGNGNGNGNGVAAAASLAAAATGTREGEGPARTLRARTSLSGAGAVAGGVTGAPVAPAPAPVPVPVPAGAIPRRTRARPVVIVVEDTEGFDTRVLADLLLALSDAGDVLPVCVLLGVATSTAMMHGMIPAAVAARLRPESFRLWSPRSIMTAVQERVLLDPGRAPALSNAALELIMTRFKEHDFSLSAARRAMHLLTLDHFMTQPLSALATAAVAAADAYAEADGDGDGDAWNFVDTPSECLANVDADVAAIASRASRVTAEAATAARAAATAACDELLTPKSLHWARKNLGAREGRRWVPEDPEEARAAIADALADAYFARRRWALALRCVAVAAAAVGLRGDKAELANLIVDASSVKWMASDVSGGEGTDEGDEGTSQGEKLVRTVCGRLERGEAGAEGLKRLLARWRRIVALDPETHAEHGAFLAETDVSDGDDAKGADEGADEDVDVVRERERENGAARAESAEPETGPEGDSADVKNADPGASPRRDTETNPPDTTRASEPPGDAPVPVPASAASDPPRFRSRGPPPRLRIQPWFRFGSSPGPGPGARPRGFGSIPARVSGWCGGCRRGASRSALRRAATRARARDRRRRARQRYAPPRRYSRERGQKRTSARDRGRSTRRRFRRCGRQRRARSRGGVSSRDDSRARVSSARVASRARTLLRGVDDVSSTGCAGGASTRARTDDGDAARETSLRLLSRRGRAGDESPGYVRRVQSTAGSRRERKRARVVQNLLRAARAAGLGRGAAGRSREREEERRRVGEGGGGCGGRQERRRRRGGGRERNRERNREGNGEGNLRAREETVLGTAGEVHARGGGTRVPRGGAAGEATEGGVHAAHGVSARSTPGGVAVKTTSEGEGRPRAREAVDV